MHSDHVQGYYFNIFLLFFMIILLTFFLFLIVSRIVCCNFVINYFNFIKILKPSHICVCECACARTQKRRMFCAFIYFVFTHPTTNMASAFVLSFHTKWNLFVVVYRLQVYCGEYNSTFALLSFAQQFGVIKLHQTPFRRKIHCLFLHERGSGVY